MLPALNRLALRASATGTAADDALGLPELVAAVLAAIDDDDYDAVCKTAGSWCRAFEASGLSCRDAHDTWRALAARVFTGAPTLDRDNAQANFYALCRRANAYRSGARQLNDSQGGEVVRVFVMAAVKHDGWILEVAGGALKKDREIVLAAVRKAGLALRYADALLKKDREIVLAAVNQNGHALYYADEDLKKDREIVLAAVKQDSFSFRYADGSLQNDPEIVLAEDTAMAAAR